MHMSYCHGVISRVYAQRPSEAPCENVGNDFTFEGGQSLGLLVSPQLHLILRDECHISTTRWHQEQTWI